MSGQKHELVSVIITTYQNVKYLPRAIESVLHQSYPAIELIVVDDNPPESGARRETEIVMKNYPDAVYIRHAQNRNGAAARNTGIRVAKGGYIAFLDNDDFYFSGHIESCVRALENRGECSCVLCGVVKIRMGVCWDLIPALRGEDLVKAMLLSETALGTGSNLFVKADAVKAIGGFDESFSRHQDVEFAIRLFSRYQAYGIEKCQIVKEMDGFSNVPDFGSFLKMKRHLWEKFQKELDCLTEAEGEHFFAGQYSSLLYTACKGKDFQCVRWTALRLKEYRRLSTKERMLVFLRRASLFPLYESFKEVMKKRRSGQLFNKVTEQLSDYDIQIFRQALADGKKG